MMALPIRWARPSTMPSCSQYKFTLMLFLIAIYIFGVGNTVGSKIYLSEKQTGCNE